MKFLLKFVPPFSWLAVFNPQLKDQRATYAKYYKDLPELDQKKRNSHFANKSDRDLFSDFEVRLLDKADEYEKRTETFLTLASSGGMIFLATAFQGTDWKLQFHVLFGACLLVAAFISVSFLKMWQIELAYFRLGEWRKNRGLLAEGKITKAEFHLRTLLTHRPPPSMAILAIIAWALVLLGYVVLIVGFANMSGVQWPWQNHTPPSPLALPPPGKGWFV